jgi:DNA helicase IV|tara:strand:+ start:124 stop:330 length:207 start_codon:yes stop_codon:yes gene_type:complete
MKSLEIMVYNPWGEKDDNRVFHLQYTDATLYNIIHEKRKKYPQHKVTVYFYGRGVSTYDPLNREEKYI